MEKLHPTPPRGVTYRDVLAHKLNSGALAVWDVLDRHVDNPTAVLWEILGEVGGATLYLPVVKSAERAHVWFRVRAGDDLAELAEDLETFTYPNELRAVAQQPLDEL
jgi:hypothetical protein